MNLYMIKRNERIPHTKVTSISAVKGDVSNPEIKLCNEFKILEIIITSFL